MKAESNPKELNRRSLLVAAVLILIGSARIVSTYSVFSHTMDEPAHLGAGMQYLSTGQYTYEDAHTPLARVFAAAGPFLAGERFHNGPVPYRESFRILGSGQHYERILTLGRIGILPFFWVGSIVVFLWANRCGGPVAALIATLLFTTLPPVLAHAAVITTDMALTAMAGATAYASLLWAEKPSPTRAAVFGALLGLALLSKFSAIPYLLVAWIVMYAGHLYRVSGPLVRVRGQTPPWQREWPHGQERGRLRSSLRHALSEIWSRRVSLAAVSGVAVFVVWAGYSFHFGPVGYLHCSLPAPEFFTGLASVWQHNRNGHASYLLGRRGTFGVWYFFPVVLALKTPLAMLVLLVWAPWLARRARGRAHIAAAAAFSAGILLFAMTSRINIGVRHVLPVYIGLSIVCGAAATAVLRDTVARWTAAKFAMLGLLAWHVASGALQHPDYLPYTNELAGNHPEDFVADSDLDWGQDMKRVGQYFQRIGVSEITFRPYNPTYLDEGGPPLPRMLPGEWGHPSPGWNAVSLSEWKVFDHPGWVAGLKPQVRIGRTTWLWYFPLPQTSPVPLVIQTELGVIEVEIAADRAPATAANFLKYVDAGLYNGARFHRTVKPGNQPNNDIKIEVIQAGLAPGVKAFPPIPLERTSATGLRHQDGTLSMARDGPDTATSDFFICIGDQPSLDFGGRRNPDGQGFAAFGKVTKGMDVVRKIQASPATGQGLTPPVKILSISRKPV